ncbi:MAG: hypothetical protein ACJ8F3_18125 [Xanthobacteraceae bacterium]
MVIDRRIENALRPEGKPSRIARVAAIKVILGARVTWKTLALRGSEIAALGGVVAWALDLFGWPKLPMSH